MLFIYKKSTSKLLFSKGMEATKLSVSDLLVFLIALVDRRTIKELHHTLNCSACTGCGCGEYHVPTPVNFRW